MENHVGRSVALHVGLPQWLGVEEASDPMERRWRTGMYKRPVSGSAWVYDDHIEGDAQADLRYHGGLEKAVCVYPSSHYPYWEQRLRQKLAHGSFGENITLDGLDESDVRVGDTFRVGQAVLQVSQPRSPCWKLARRWREKSLALWWQQTGFVGWYMRVLEPGEVSASNGWSLLEKGASWATVELIHGWRYRADVSGPSDLDTVVRYMALSPRWRDAIFRRYDGKTPVDTKDLRLIGPNGE